MKPTKFKLLALGSYLASASAQPDFSFSANLSTWNNTEWSLTTTKFLPGHYQSRLYLSNGYTGASLATSGPFWEADINSTGSEQPTNGWPLFDPRETFATISGFYDIQPNGTGTNYPWLNQYGYESFMSGIPHPTAIYFGFGNNYFNATVSNDTISNFQSKLCFKTGVAEWFVTWSPPDTTSFNISYAILFSRKRPNVVVVSSSITPLADVNGTVTDLLDGRSAVRSYLKTKGLDDNGTTIHTSIHPNGLANVTGHVVSGVDFSNRYTNLTSRVPAAGGFFGDNNMTIGQTFDISLKAGETATFFKTVGIASTDKFLHAEAVARQAQAQAQSDGWEMLLQEHKDAWAEIMTLDSINDLTNAVTGELPDDPYLQQLQISLITSQFYLMQELQPDGSGLNDNSIPVSGLASSSYGGLVFWDADVWMAPSLNLVYPEWSKQITNFRVKQHPQALANAAFNGYPNGSALYSWTAGRYGNCTGTGPCVDYEYHLNYDIAFNLIQLYNVTNNETWFNDGPRQLVESIATMTGELLQFNETTQTYWIHNMTDPDEYANNVDNGAFTIASAAELLKTVNALRVSQGLPINETWQNQSQNIAFPTAPSNITKEYQTMNNSVAVKQADVALLTYPLDYGDRYSAADKLLDIEYYANKQSPDGPGMTYSVFSIGANSVSQSGCADYTYLMSSFNPYVRGPFNGLSEQAVDDPTLNGGTNPAFPFLTGMGGFLQSMLFGLLGVRTHQRSLYINPSLPPQIPTMKPSRFRFGGATIYSSMNITHTNITRRVTPLSVNIIDKYANTTMPFKVGVPNSPDTNVTSYHIRINETITVPNRMYSWKLTILNNLIQCHRATSSDAFVPGQFPFAANDGSSATRWQPASNSSASTLIAMADVLPNPVSALYFDWGMRPPLNVTVYMGNSTGRNYGHSGAERKIVLDNITPEFPYNASAAARSSEQVVPVVGNSTTFHLPHEIWSGDYVRLEMEGCWEPDGIGATVGEFAVLHAA